MGYASRVAISARGAAATRVLDSQATKNHALEKLEVQNEGVQYAILITDWFTWSDDGKLSLEAAELTKLRIELKNDINFTRIGEGYGDIEAETNFLVDPFDIEISVDFLWNRPGASA